MTQPIDLDQQCKITGQGTNKIYNIPIPAVNFLCLGCSASFLPSALKLFSQPKTSQKIWLIILLTVKIYPYFVKYQEAI